MMAPMMTPHAKPMSAAPMNMEAYGSGRCFMVDSE